MTTIGYDGAIYFEYGFNVKLFRICGLYCCSVTSIYQISFLQTNNNQTLNIIIID